MQPRRFDLKRASTVPFAVAILTGAALCLLVCVSKEFLRFAVGLFLLVTLLSFFVYR